MSLLTETAIQKYPLVGRGKVRDIYDLGHHLLIIATDRISAFDVVFGEPIPEKGRVLTGLSVFWFAQTKSTIANHLVTDDIDAVPNLSKSERALLKGRSMLVEKGEVVPVECIVRGYLAGNGWKDYQASGMVNGIRLPAGLKESGKLPEPIFTPTTKESTGHDQPITFIELVNRVGKDLADQLRDYALKLYGFAAALAETKGIIIADTKFEFARINGQLTVVDEIFTPDSSRFWPGDKYVPGGPQPSFDKQYVRDYLEGINWDKSSPPPPLPEDVIEMTSKKYLEAYRRIVGMPLK